MTTPEIPWSIPLVTTAGRATTLGEWRDRVLLIVNVASRCVHTPQYAGLEALYRAHREAGLTILALPCDQFGHQEPGSNAEIAAYCEDRYGITFPVLAKGDVNGRDTHPLFRWLKHERPGFLWLGTIKWNFTKFLVDRHGRVRARFAPATLPSMIAPRLPALLAA